MTNNKITNQNGIFVNTSDNINYNINMLLGYLEIKKSDLGIFYSS